MQPAKILILSSSHPCRNPRALKEAATLGAAGYAVTILTIRSSARFFADDQSLLAGQPFRVDYVDLVGADWPGRLGGYVQRGATKFCRHLLRSLRIETSQALGPARLLLRDARRRPADLTIAHTEIPLWTVRHLMHDGRRVAVDFEDWYSEDLLETDRSHRPLKLLRKAESFALRHACYCSTTSASLATALQARHGGNPAVVLHNTFPLQTRTRQDRPAATDPLRLVWFSQTVGPGRGLEWFVPGWGKTQPASRLTLIGEQRPDYGEFLRGLLPAARRDDLELLPAVASADLPDRLTEFDAGLALEPHFPPNKDVTISNKIFQYLNAGLALIATDTSGQLEVIKAAPGCALVVREKDPAEWIGQLDRLLGDPARLQRMQQCSRAAAERIFCWEMEAPRLLATVAQALAGPNPPAR
jgi:glycosyltransferase involved in cell wall biosynthesis